MANGILRFGNDRLAIPEPEKQRVAILGSITCKYNMRMYLLLSGRNDENN
jgi:hypothetical protein